MKIVPASVAFLHPVDGNAILKHLERCGRVCYKSETKITPDSAQTFVARILKSGHEAVLEHASFSVQFIVDRGVSHEMVRHRLASYCQESTRYCNYGEDRFGGQITVIEPCFLQHRSGAWELWKANCQMAENTYLQLIDCGYSPQEARVVLPTSLKTEVVMTANLREWRHFLKLRCAPNAHPQIREVATKLLDLVHMVIPVVFDDIRER